MAAPNISYEQCRMQYAVMYALRLEHPRLSDAEADDLFRRKLHQAIDEAIGRPRQEVVQEIIHDLTRERGSPLTAADAARDSPFRAKVAKAVKDILDPVALIAIENLYEANQAKLAAARREIRPESKIGWLRRRLA